MFRIILGLSALIIAGCAAFFSVQGLASLYTGQFLAVCIMAGSLEFGKLIAASYLHRYWESINIFLKSYLILAVFVLMGITSLGIFGFLTSAYQQSHIKVEIIDTKKISLDSKKQNIQIEINNLIDRIDTLNKTRLSQEKRLPEMSRKSAAPIYEDMKKSSDEILKSQKRIEDISNEIKSIDDELINLKTEESKSTDIGTLKFVAELFNVEVSTIVKWFTIIIVLVFDPLAVSLVLAYTNINSIKNISIPISKENNDKNFKRLNEINVKYKDK